jgi:hypothetical protein
MSEEHPQQLGKEGEHELPMRQAQQLLVHLFAEQEGPR